MRSLRWVEALSFCVALASCNTSNEVKLKPHCYASTHSFAETGQCECRAFADEASYPSTDWDPHTSCSASELPPKAVCCAQFGDVSACACARPACFGGGTTGECLCGVTVPTLGTDDDDTVVTDCNPSGTLDCCNFGNGVCTCVPGHNTACDAAVGTHVADCTVADASVQCSDNGLGLTMQVTSCEDVTYECSTDADCDETCAHSSCARCLTTGSCLCGTEHGSTCSY